MQGTNVHRAMFARACCKTMKVPAAAFNGGVTNRFYARLLTPINNPEGIEKK
jgi:hypothetical protein